ncbi:hypothetical protein [Actinoplanes sp. NPDC026619]|uniref:hypothetical protein n=1 Tax=Actinoplanes sp. NPDC026619 TaxID=3155798 RepID=UPI0033F75FA3
MADELDRLLAETLHGAAHHAPVDDGLLAEVHRRSAKLRRRRVALSAAAVVLVAGVPAGFALVERPPVTVVAPVAPAVRLSAGWTVPAFPYTLPATEGMTAPVARMQDGDLIALFEATEQQHHADITVTVSAAKPAFSGTASEKQIEVRGKSGTLRTVDVRPAKQLTVYWPEDSGRWIRLATDDTYTPQQVVALADALTPASVAMAAPFRLDLSPAGLTADTITESRISFGGGAVTIVLRKRLALGTPNEQVGPYEAVLTDDKLDVDVTDWNATLELTGHTDLLRLAAGVHILDRSNPES